MPELEIGDLGEIDGEGRSVLFFSTFDERGKTFAEGSLQCNPIPLFHYRVSKM